MAKTNELVLEAKKRLGRAIERDYIRERMADDVKFIYNPDGDNQWDDSLLEQRKGRPCYTFNRTIGAVNQVIGDQRQNKPTIKVRGVDSEADPDTAEVLTGLIRNIENISDSETAYDTAFKHAVTGGFGVWKVGPEFAGDNTFDQDIKIKRVANPFTVYFDPAAKDFQKRDANWVIITERISKDEFRALYPNASTSDLDFDDKDGRWLTSHEIRVAEYYRKVRKKKTIALLSDGRSVDYDADFRKVEDDLAEIGVTVERKREVSSHVIEWAKISGAEVLEGPIEYNWKYIPVVGCFGRSINIEGEDHYEGVARHSRDAQKSYNYARSNAVEGTALQPKAPWVATAKMIKGYEDQYRQAGAKNFPVMLYNVDEDAPNARPVRELPPQASPALISQAQMDADDIRSTTGFFAPSLGEPSNETSGIAIGNRQREGDIGSFEFVDNLGKAIRFTGEILIDMIPQVYDTARQVRILGVDGKEEFVSINQEVIDEETGEKKLVNDLNTGKYDVVVTLGPSFTTQRQEALAGLTEVAGVVPIVGQVAADLIVKNLDVPGAEALEKRVKTALIQTGVIQPGDNEEDAELMEEINAAAERQNQVINEELERERIQEEAKLQREQVAAQGDIDKEELQLAAEAAKRDADKTEARLRRQHENEKMSFERYKLAADLAAQELARQGQIEGNASEQVFNSRVEEIAASLAEAASQMAAAAQLQSAPRRLITDDEGNPIGSEPFGSVN